MAKTLLPPGCYDLLPPFARLETALVAGLLATFEAHGYAQAAPPLLEYTESLLAGRGAALSPQVFRLMDTGANKVMGLRADITLQIARIAAGRLHDAPLPLRLSYAGPVLRAEGENRGGRQLTQAGIELIGPDAPEADAEAVLVAASALKAAGLEAFSVDLNMPGITLALLEGEALDNATLTNLLQSVAHKDVAAIAAAPVKHADTLAKLAACAGPAGAALSKLKQVKLPKAAAELAETLTRVAALVAADFPKEATLTIDVTESRGLEYHTGVTFSFFAKGAAAEIGSGGRYVIDDGHFSRPATGCTLYVNALSRLVPQPPLPKKVFITGAADSGTLAALHTQGFVTVRALPGYNNDRAAAAELGCTHYFANGSLDEL